MNTGRAALLLRRLSTGDNRLKNLSLNQNSTKDSVLLSPVNGSKELGLPKRVSTCNSNFNPLVQVKRSYSDHIIKMSGPSVDPNPNKTEKHTNHLIKEKSPYLLQHAHNPVEWYPWCEEAIERAQKENKLIFLSVGYSTCHWCHVMEKESFENESVAQVMNEHFINIKVDREERPDIDRVYMLFIMATTGGGGWPMSVFLTPDLHPVTGGTYFPPEDRWGRPGFKTILLSLAKKWKENRDQFVEAGNSILQALQGLSISDSQANQCIPGEETWLKGIRRLISVYEPEFGGFGTAPKFPQPSNLNFLFHYYARDKKNADGMKCLDMCLYTLTKMAKGGIHDHLGGGFARYSVDNDWHVPHFEKMLYDQAQLIAAYSDAYLATKDEDYANVVRDIIKYCNRDLKHPAGGFYSAEDADSYPTFESNHKKEGAFYVWDYTELESLLGDKKLHSASCFDVFCDYFSVEEEGNISPESDPHQELTGKNVLIIYGNKEKTSETFGLTVPQLEEIIAECTDILFKERNNRPRPEVDTKMISSWNGLMIAGLSQAGQSLSEKQFVEEAIKTANFVKEHLYDTSTGLLHHSCYKGDDGTITQIEKPIQGFLDDYAFLIKGLLDLYEASLDMAWLNWARQLQAKQNELFWDSTSGGYYSCSADDKTVVMMLKEENDGAEPSGNSISCHNLLRLAIYPNGSAESDQSEKEMAKKLLMAFAKKLTESPGALPEMMSALMFYNDSPTQVLIAGGPADPRTLELVRVVRSKLLPGRVLTVADPAESSNGDLLSNRIRCVGGVPTAYVCRRFACSLPVTDGQQLASLLDEPHLPARDAH